MRDPPNRYAGSFARNWELAQGDDARMLVTAILNPIGFAFRLKRNENNCRHMSLSHCDGYYVVLCHHGITADAEKK